MDSGRHMCYLIKCILDVNYFSLLNIARAITGIKPSASRDCSTYQFRCAFGIGVSTIKIMKVVLI